MRVLIINGSPRADGNTSELVKQFRKAIGSKAAVDEVRIYDMDIKGCRNCGACQKKTLKEHCAISDGMTPLYQKFLSSDVVVLATPIYMWQFTPCTMAFLNRLHCLCRSSDFSYNEMEGKAMAAMMTMGAEEEVADYASNGLRDLCEFFRMEHKSDLRIPFAEKERISSGEYGEKINTFAENILR